MIAGYKSTILFGIKSALTLRKNMIANLPTIKNFGKPK